jgi:hypothetical protein
MWFLLGVAVGFVSVIFIDDIVIITETDGKPTVKWKKNLYTLTEVKIK